LPLCGSIAICPDKYKNDPTLMAWLYGPIGSGALLVYIVGI